jgi:hypothetical protein
LSVPSRAPNHAASNVVIPSPTIQTINQKAQTLHDTGEVVTMMHTYRCYLLNGHRHIAAVEVIECRDDGIAKRRAEQILAAQLAVSGVEVWEWDRRVHVRLSSDALELHEG